MLGWRWPINPRLSLLSSSPLLLPPPSSPALPVLSNHDVLDSRKEKKKVYFGILSWISSWLQICEFRSTDAVNIINNFSNMHTRVSKRKYLHQLPCMIGFETLKIYFSLYLPNFSQFLYKSNVKHKTNMSFVNIFLALFSSSFYE